jgi:phosphoglycolate phosphatase
MRYKLAIFDLDGTVLNTIGGLTHAVNAALAMNGLPERSRDEVQAMVGNGTRKLIERALGEDADPELISTVYSDYQKYYAENCSYDTYPYDGIKQMLIKLNEAGIKCAVVTNKPDIPAKKLIQENFGSIIAETHGNVPEVPVKPDPTFVYETMKNLGVNPSEAVYIGDSDVDIRTGKNAGIDYISVDWGFRTREFLVENGARIIFSDPFEVADYLIL